METPSRPQRHQLRLNQIPLPSCLRRKAGPRTPALRSGGRREQEPTAPRYRSFALLANLMETDSRLKVVRLRRNFGQTATLSAGFHEAQGDVVVSLDGDLQHDPSDIPALLAKIDEG